MKKFFVKVFEASLRTGHRFSIDWVFRGAFIVEDNSETEAKKKVRSILKFDDSGNRHFFDLVKLLNGKDFFLLECTEIKPEKLVPNVFCIGRENLPKF